ncbi:amino acid ABC transporter substrate-binding protein [Aliidongia sp.]|uniref:amino acid ABC transporter substrate-binding protein n=1 Tax=Aliidongia sp. TaxID=1914230 RepID=UPI0039C86026
MGKIIGVALAAGLMGGLLMGTARPAQAGVTLDAVRQRGHVTCGVNTGVAGFSLPDSKGNWTGLDIDLCRAIAAAVFLDPSKAIFVPTTAVQRFPAVQSGEIDVLTRNATQTLTREASLGLHMTGVNFYDGQGFMVPKKSGVKSLKQLGGATVCVQPGTTTELNLADYARANHMELKPVVIERVDDDISALSSGRCDAFTTDSSQLASLRVTAMPQPDDWLILPELISKEPLGPMVRNGDDQWLNIVKWTLLAMIQAEELGITQANVDEKTKSPNPEVQRFLGVTAGNGQALGLDEKWAYTIVKAVGNYGESFERNMGKGSPIKLDRGLNELWTRGGLMYALPLR